MFYYWKNFIGYDLVKNLFVPALEQTWLPNCDAHHYYSNSAEGMEKLPVHELFNFLPISYWKLFWKSRLALYYTYTNVSQDFDWYLKSDDDSYFIIDRLKSYLKTFNPNIPHLIGYRLIRNYPNGYVSGGAGYILSREALRLFATEAFENSTICKYHPWEDLGISKCLNNLGIPTKDTRTKSLKQRFMPFSTDEHFYSKVPKEWIFDDMQYTGFDIFHKELISFHHLKPSELRLIHGLITRINSD
uniref:N-acetylgalactosaminide beta-1,3-galactosyltransferase n=1 Tax=Panagrolaimus davidi TaxID=227884 RepID=A0A914QTU1_9BILA